MVSTPGVLGWGWEEVGQSPPPAEEAQKEGHRKLVWSRADSDLNPLQTSDHHRPGGWFSPPVHEDPASAAPGGRG